MPLNVAGLALLDLDDPVSPSATAAQHSIPSLTGRWRVVHNVETSERDRYVGLKIEFLFSLTEFGGAIVGNGRKIGVNERVAEEEEMSLLEISGEIRSNEVKLSLLERRRQDMEHSLIGEIIWQSVTADHLAGHFQVDVGGTRGRSEAFRMR